MGRRFDGRVALVVGGGHGIGRATAARLSAEGASVVVADVDVDAATVVATECGHRGPALAVACDVTDAASVASAVDAGVERFGRLDVLAHTAGGDATHGRFADTADGAWDRLVDLNLTGVARCIRAALPHLLAAPAGGSVVAIGSVNGLVPYGSEPYSAAKAGLQNLTANLATQYGRRGVRFNLVAPGTVRTRVWDDRQDELDRLARAYPLGRVGEPDDIAAAVAFLASDDAAWITGVVLPVDGGIVSAGALAGVLMDDGQ
ncbi:MAG: SDR family oxidoreductase [Streptosporangiales bacterium]|nr:SDR family oxidoreductase [Streptosporangiales bacterium]